MKSTYERELLAVIFAVQKWGQYLLDSHFIIQTDQQSLKYLLENKISTPFQQKWLSKLLGFDYEIRYKQGITNKVADALSRVQSSELLTMALSMVQSGLIKEISASWKSDEGLQLLINNKEKNSGSHNHYSWQGGELRRKGKLVVGNVPDMRNRLIKWHHTLAQGGHSGVTATWKRLTRLFYWKGIKRDMVEFIKRCVTCQKCKSDTVAYPGMLQPLPIPQRVWEDVSMDFIEGLPKSGGKEVILVVVDRLSKYAHFVALSHPFTAITVAQVFMDQIFKLHEFPKSILSDRDAIFLSTFWTELLAIQGMDQNLTTAYHPQSNGQTKVVNRCLEVYLRCMCSDKPMEWIKWLPLAEYWYNTSYHSTIETTPFEVVYGHPPPIHLPYLPGESNLEAVDRSLLAREQTIKLLKHHMARAQNKMKQLADGKRTERQFKIGDWVYLKIQA